MAMHIEDKSEGLDGLIILFIVNEEPYKVTNIIPTTMSELTREEYNNILIKFLMNLWQHV